MGQSHRHHYVPQFLLRQFTDATGQFYVYDKATKQIQRRGTKGSFFGWDRNMVELAGQQVDNLEQLYAELDADFARNLQLVLRGGPLEPEQVASIFLLASTQKWRHPGIDASFDQLKNDLSLQELGAELRYTGDDPQGVDPAIVQEIVNSEMFKEAKRVMLPVLPFLQDDEALFRVRYNSFVQFYDVADIAPNLLGDCTIVEQPGNAYNKLGNFIFPLSSKATFIYRVNQPRSVTPIFKASSDLAMIHYSHRYVGCSDKSYLTKMIEAYDELHRKFGQQVESLLLRSLF